MSCRLRKNRIATLLLALVCLGLLVMAEEVVRTTMKRRECQAGIHRCEERIKKAKPDADRNRELQTQIGALEPTVALVREAQRITLRWVSLMGELDASVPDPKQVHLSQLSFSSGGAAAAKKAQPGTIGALNVAGVARSYAQVAETMRRLSAQDHVREVRLVQAAASKEEGIQFSCRAQFHIPDNEEVVMAAAEPAAKGRDYTAALQKAGENTVLNRTPVESKDTQ
jgi:Tfp pilus assembly protein PilN